MFITYSVCHMTGMSSACANPLLYGWLNDNFRKEFCAIWASVTDRFRSAPRHPKLASDKSATNRPQITNSIVSAFPPSMGNQTKVSTHVIAIAEIPDQSSNPPDVSKSVWDHLDTHLLRRLWLSIQRIFCMDLFWLCSHLSWVPHMIHGLNIVTTGHLQRIWISNRFQSYSFDLLLIVDIIYLKTRHCIAFPITWTSDIQKIFTK